MIKKHVHGSQKILDVGASKGVLHQQLVELNKDVVGIDIDVPLGDARRIIEMDAQDLGESDEFEDFDLIVAGELIEHLPDPEKFIKGAYKVLRKGGTLVITTPNKDSWWNRLTKSYHHREHVSVMNKEQLIRLLKRNRLKIETFTYIPYDKFTSGSDMGWMHMYRLRNMVHDLIPENLRENMFIVAKKE